MNCQSDFMKNISKYILNIFLFLIIFDFTGDSIMRSYNFNLTKLEFFFKAIISILFLILLIINFKIKLYKNYFPFIFICLIFLYGFILGIINNKILNAINELFGFSFILLTPVIVNIYKKDIFVDDKSIKYIKILTYIILFKILVYSILTIIIFGVPSYKILLKQTPLFLITFSILLDKILNKENGLNFLFLLTCFILSIAIARMIYISMAFIIIIHFIKNLRLNALKYQLKILLLIILSFFMYLYIQSMEYTGTIDRIYGGDIYQDGLDYRTNQFFIILKRFYEFPMGAGFGYFTPNYLTYGELAKPYLLELDLFNFFSKIGILFSFFYILIYIYIFIKLKNIPNLQNFSFFSFYIGIFSLLIYSLGQTAHQGYLYWVSFSIFYSTFILYKNYLKKNI